MEKSYKNIKTKVVCILLFLFLLLGATIIFSPYRTHPPFSYRLIKQTVDINVPAKKVFSFLGNSANASRWSTFVDHITVINRDSFADGTAGSRRRCFRNSNEKGMQWDELVIESELNKKRLLSIYNLVNFPVSAKNLATEQLYETIGKEKCRLTFTVFFKVAKPSFWDAAKLYLTAYKINSVFTRNLSNIKKITQIEEK